jgi:carbonic anhydrase
MSHTCDALVVDCMDFRLQKYIREFTDINLKNKTFDLVSYAGSTKNLEIITEQIDTSVKLHQIKEVHLIHHEDCGAYGKEGTFTRHLKDLKTAKNEILKRHPQLKVYLYYLYLNGIFKTIK